MLAHKIISALTVLLITSAHATIVEKDIRGLYNILKAEYAYLSPLHGLMIQRNRILPTIRFHGNYGPENPAYQCHKQLNTQQKQLDCPQDPMAVLIQQLFPSPGGGQLVPNNSLDDVFIKNLDAGTAGAILHIILLFERERDLLHDEKVRRLTNGILKTHKAPQIADPAYEQQIKDFSQIVVNALEYNQEFPHNYPLFLVEQALLAFVVKKEATKKDNFVDFFEQLGKEYLKPEFVKDGHISLPSDWNSYYSAEDYLKFRATFENNMPTPKSLEKMLKNPEDAAFYTMAYEIYDEAFPRTPDFSLALFPAPKRDEVLTPFEIKEREYPDCGENSLRNFLNVMFYDALKKLFDAEALNKMAPNADKLFIAFFQRQRPDNLEAMRNDWSELVSNLNARVKDKKSDLAKIIVRYSKDRPAGTCDIYAGLDNLLKVAVHLLNDQKLTKIALNYNARETALRELNKVVNTFKSSQLKPTEDALSKNRLAQLVYKKKENLTPAEDLEYKALLSAWQKLDAEKNALEKLLKDNLERFKSRLDPDNIPPSSYPALDALLAAKMAELRPNMKKSQEVSEEILTRLTEMISNARENFKVSWQVQGQNGGTKILDERNVVIEFIINGKALFRWSFTPGHFDFQPLPSDTQRDWRKAAASTMFRDFNDLGKQYFERSGNFYPAYAYGANLLPFYIKPNDASTLLNLLDPPLPTGLSIPFLYSLPMDVSGKIAAIGLALAEKISADFETNAALMQVVSRWIKALPDDTVAIGALWDKLYPLRNSLRGPIKKWFDEKTDVIGSSMRSYLLPALNFDWLNVIRLFLEKDPQILIKQKVSAHQSIVQYAIEKGSVNVLKLLLSWPKLMKWEIQEHDNPLLYVAGLENPKEEVVKLLLTPPMVLKEFLKDENGDTPLHKAIPMKNVGVVKLLLSVPILLDKDVVKNKRGNTPLHVAISEGEIDIVKLLLNTPTLLSADFAKNARKIPPLYLAAQSSNLEMVKLLLTVPQFREPDMLKIPDGSTPLHEAAQDGDVEMIKLLLESLISWNKDLLRDKFGNSPTFYAISNKYLEVLKILLTKPLFLEKEMLKNNQGNSLLHEASKYNASEDIVKYLLAIKEINWLAPDLWINNRNETPIDLAKANPQIKQLFEEFYSAKSADAPQDQ